MCVIAVQTKLQPVLSYDEISAMCNHNPHGFGLMWNDGKQCHYKKRIKSSHGTADVCIMMNGIIGDSTKEFSDTALYTMNNLKSYWDTDKRFYKHFNRQQQILFDNEISGCRFAFMDKNTCDLFGYGWSDYEGKCSVSNKYWIPVKYDYSYYSRDYSYYSRLWDYLDEWGNEVPWSDKPAKAKRFATKKKDKRHKRSRRKRLLLVIGSF